MDLLSRLNAVYSSSEEEDDQSPKDSKPKMMIKAHDTQPKVELAPEVDVSDLQS
jgi:hypothetical protein